MGAIPPPGGDEGGAGFATECRSRAAGFPQREARREDAAAARAGGLSTRGRRPECCMTAWLSQKKPPRRGPESQPGTATEQRPGTKSSDKGTTAREEQTRPRRTGGPDEKPPRRSQNSRGDERRARHGSRNRGTTTRTNTSSNRNNGRNKTPPRRGRGPNSRRERERSRGNPHSRQRRSRGTNPPTKSSDNRSRSSGRSRRRPAPNDTRPNPSRSSGRRRQPTRPNPTKQRTTTNGTNKNKRHDKHPQGNNNGQPGPGRERSPPTNTPRIHPPAQKRTGKNTEPGTSKTAEGQEKGQERKQGGAPMHPLVFIKLPLTRPRRP